MKIIANRYLCLSCRHCRDILTPQKGREEKDHNGKVLPDIPLMPNIAYNDGWIINRLSPEAIELLKTAVIECPGEALSFEE